MNLFISDDTRVIVYTSRFLVAVDQCVRLLLLFFHMFALL